MGRSAAMLAELRFPQRPRQRVAVAAIAAMLLPAIAVGTAAPITAHAACQVLAKIEPGTHNVGVPCLETRLIAMGYTSISRADLFYDPIAVRAVQDFQIQRGLYPDGIVTSITARELGLRGRLPTGPGTPRLTIIGDSTSAAMRWYDEANNRTQIYDVMGGTYDLLWSLESCRRLVATSCVGRVDPGTGHQWRPISVLPLMRGSLKGRLGQALVIMAGYDDVDIGTAIDQVMAEARAQGVPTVYWLTYRTSTTYGYASYYRQHNAQLAAAAGKYANLVVLDWNTYSRSLPAATQAAWFASDDVHMTRLGGLGLATWLRHRIAPAHIERCVAALAGAGGPGTAVGSITTVTTPTGFHALDPNRIFDTRTASLGGGKGALAAGRMITLDLNGRVPTGTESVAVNVTAINPCQAGAITVFACGARPALASMALAPARTGAALAISPVAQGRLCIHTTGTTDLAVDLLGAFAPGGSPYHPVTPVRFFTTRAGVAVAHAQGPLSAPTDITVQVAGKGGVPADATAVWLNAATVDARTAASMAVWPGACGTTHVSSTVNVLAGRTTGNGILVGLGADGAVCVHLAAGSADIAIDLSGWFGGAAPGGLLFRQAGPRGLTGTVVPTTISGGSSLALPGTATGFYGITTSNSAHVSTVSARPCGTATPSYVLTGRPEERVSNVAAVAPGTGGWCIGASATTNVTVVLLGSFVPAPPS